jgi:hypothetical protein
VLAKVHDQQKIQKEDTKRKLSYKNNKARRLTNLALEPILGCSHGLNESQRCSPDPELFSQPDESKRAEKMLEPAIYKSRAKELKRCFGSPCPKSFHTWMRVRRLRSQHSIYPGLFS